MSNIMDLKEANLLGYMRYFFYLFMSISLLQFCSEAVMANESKNMQEPGMLLGVDNYIITGDTLQLMNVLMLDYQVEYDASLVNKNYQGVANSLHKIALLYFTMHQFDLATNYSWRMNNVSKKHNLKEQGLYSLALLARIYEQKGEIKRANNFLKQYNQLLEEVNANPSMRITKLDTLGSIERLSPKEKELEVVILEPALVETLSLNPSEQKATFISERKKEFWFVILALGVFVIGFWIKGNEKKNQIQNPISISNSPIVNIESRPVVGVENPRVKEIESTEIDIVSPNKPTKTKIMDEFKSVPPKKENPRSNVESNVLSPELIISKRSEKLFKDALPVKLPLWVSGIEHHLMDLDTFNGIKVDFNHLGDFTLINEKTSAIISEFVIAVSDTLVDANNVKSVSSQLVNSTDGWVVMMTARPITDGLPVLDVITINSIEKIFHSSKNMYVTTHNVPGGLLKFVLKQYVNQVELQG